MPTRADLGRLVRSNISSLASANALLDAELNNLSSALGFACSSTRCGPRKGELLRFTGNIKDAPFQVLTYLSLVEALARARHEAGEGETTVCETGFNAGHSALLFLLAHPNTRYIGFELGDPYRWESNEYRARVSDPAKRLMWASRRAEELLAARFPARINVTYGNSHETIVPYFAARPGVACDVVSVDGDHTFNGVATDLQQLSPHMRRGSLLFVDDCRERSASSKMFNAYASFASSFPQRASEATPRPTATSAADAATTPSDASATERWRALLRVHTANRPHHGFCVASFGRLPGAVSERLRRAEHGDYEVPTTILGSS